MRAWATFFKTGCARSTHKPRTNYVGSIFVNMRSLIHIFTLILSIFSSVKATSSLSNEASGIIELTDENFEHLTQASTGQTTGKWFVFFSSQKCPHCTTLYPKWKTLSEELSTEHPDSSVLVAMVDVTNSPELVQRFNIQSMPTLYYFADMGMYEYGPKSPRNVDSLINYVLEGYKSGEKLDVPSRPRLLQMVADLRKHVHDIEVLNALLNDFEEILLQRKNAAVLLFLTGAAFGILLCTLEGALTNSAGRNKAKID